MHIAVGCDHAGFDLKQAVMGLLTELGYSYEDFGCHNSCSIDYPDVALPVAEAVAQGRFDQGILVCSTGIGMSIVANKTFGIRAALCHDGFSARRAREHNDANIICLGQWVIGKGLMREIVAIYLRSEFAGGRHTGRIEKIRAVEGHPKSQENL
ncbi:ribose 5-phosphate isomerase B [Chloroflexota bacterium]